MSTDRQLADGVRESIYAMTGHVPLSKRDRTKAFFMTLLSFTLLLAGTTGAYLAYFKLVLGA